MIRLRTFTNTCQALLLATFAVSAIAAGDKPNILVVWGDDIGQSNISLIPMA